jgi:hypothetical protein
MTRTRASVRFTKAAAIVSAGLLAGGAVVTAPNLAAEERGRGSVRHSTAAERSKDTTGPRGQGKVTTPERRAATRVTTRRSTRAGVRRGYRAGRHAAWHDARRHYRRWRRVTGLFRLGVYLATRPPKTTTVVVTGTTYYYSGGVYFVQSGSGYVVVAPPPGAVVYAVPTATTLVYVGTTRYFYYGGTFYVMSTKPAEQPPPPDPSAAAAPSGEGEQTLADVPMTDDEENYAVVAPPPGATVPYMPDEADETTVNGKTYYVHDDTYYQPFSSGGDTIYMVVENPRRQA